MATQTPTPSTQAQEKKDESKEEVPVKKGAEKKGALQRMKNPATQLLQRLRRRGGSRTEDVLSTNPFTMMRRMSDDLDRMFDDFWSRSLADEFFDVPEVMGDRRGLWSPRIDVFERGDDLVVRADLPGIKREELNIEVVGCCLIIEGERKYEHEEERRGYYRSEREYGEFRRVLPLPDGVDIDDAKATFDGGILEVTIKQPHRESKRIEIGAAETKALAGKEEEKVH